MGIGAEIVQLFARTLGDVVLVTDVPAGTAAEDVRRQVDPLLFPEVPDVLVPVRPDRTHRCVPFVPRHLRVDVLARDVVTAGQQREKTPAVDPVRTRQIEKVEDRRQDVDVAREVVVAFPAVDDARQARDERGFDAGVVTRPFRPGERQPVIGREHDERLVVDAGVFERREHLADGPIHRGADESVQVRDLFSDLGAVGEVRHRFDRAASYASNASSGTSGKR